MPWMINKNPPLSLIEIWWFSTLCELWEPFSPQHPTHSLPNLVKFHPVHPCLDILFSKDLMLPPCKFVSSFLPSSLLSRILLHIFQKPQASWILISVSTEQDSHAPLWISFPAVKSDCALRQKARRSEASPHSFPLPQGSQSCVAYHPVSEHSCFIYFLQFSSCFKWRVHLVSLISLWLEVEVNILILKSYHDYILTLSWGYVLHLLSLFSVFNGIYIPWM